MTIYVSRMVSLLKKNNLMSSVVTAFRAMVTIEIMFFSNLSKFFRKIDGKFTDF